MPLVGAQLEVFATGATGERLGAALLSQRIAEGGSWSGLSVSSSQPLEFVITASGYATTHIYRSGFARSSSIVHLRAERIADADVKDTNAKRQSSTFLDRAVISIYRVTT
jgi:hypothetical protein